MLAFEKFDKTVIGVSNKTKQKYSEKDSLENQKSSKINCHKIFERTFGIVSHCSVFKHIGFQKIRGELILDRAFVVRRKLPSHLHKTHPIVKDSISHKPRTLIGRLLCFGTLIV